MPLPRISIVVPSYNQGAFLEETLTSIIDQKYPNLELFVVDGGSTDNSVDVIRKYADNIDWWVSEKDRGQSDAINKGFRKASGDIITWINSDDTITPGSLAAVAAYFSELDPGIGLIHGGIILFRDKVELQKDWGYRDISVERYLAGMAFSQPAAFFRKRYLDMIGGQVTEELHFGMDYDLYARLALVCKFKPVTDVFARYRLHEASKSVADQHKFIRDWTHAFVNLCKNLGWNDTLSELREAIGEKQELEYYKKYTFAPDPSIVEGIDKKRLTFYHLCYHVKASYLAGNFEESRRILKWIRRHYQSDWINNEKSIPQIKRNLGFPDIIIRFMQKMKARATQ